MRDAGEKEERQEEKCKEKEEWRREKEETRRPEEDWRQNHDLKLLQETADQLGP